MNPGAKTVTAEPAVGFPLCPATASDAELDRRATGSGRNRTTVGTWDLAGRRRGPTLPCAKVRPILAETPKVQTARKKKTCHGNLQGVLCAEPSEEIKIWHAYYGIPFNPPAWSLDGGGDSREIWETT